MPRLHRGDRRASREVRARICESLAWLGVAIDPAANARDEDDLEAPGSRVAVRRIATDEEIVIARAVRRVMGQ